MTDPTAGIGSVADWVSGIATFLTLLATLLVLLFDRRSARKAQADSFLVWIEGVSDFHSMGGDFWRLKMRVENGSDAPIHSAYVVALHPQTIHRFYPLRKSKSVFDGREVEHVSIELPVSPADYGLVLAFRDRNQRIWYRDLKKSRYIGRIGTSFRIRKVKRRTTNSTLTTSGE